MSALLMQAMLVGGLLTVAQAPVAAPPPAVAQVNPAPSPAPSVPSDAPASKAPTPVPWKTITKVGSGVSYAVWVALWTVMVPVGFVGLTLLGLSGTQNNAGYLAGGAVLAVVSVALFLLGTAAAVTGAGFGIGTTVQQLLHPDDHAVDSTLSMFMPLTLLL
jgi:hypothetical protein